MLWLAICSGCSCRFPRALWFGLGAPRQVHEHHNRERHHDDGNELGGREHPDRAAGIAPIELDDEARYPVEQEIQPERPAGKRPSLAPDPHGEDEEKQENAADLSIDEIQKMIEEAKANFNYGEDTAYIRCNCALKQLKTKYQNYDSVEVALNDTSRAKDAVNLTKSCY